MGAYAAVGVCAVVEAQGFGRVALVGLLCMAGCLTQGLVALTGLRTLGFGRDSLHRGLHGRWGLCRRWDPGFGRVAPIRLLCMEGCLTQGLVALTGLRTLGFEEGSPL